MLLAGGTLDGVEVLKQETVRLMARNAIGDLDVPTVRSNNPALALEVETFPGQVKRWGLTFLINTEDVEGFRAAGSLTWGGIHNTYFWIDLKQRRALSPVNASRPPSRTTAHDSGSMWFATPSS
jgi:methyl acetate hydrolase